MASKNNNDNPQNTKHCVLIDGDFGRHELFGNIYPYTLNRFGKLNNAVTFKIYTEEAMKLMNNASNIHYHICNNSFAKEIDEYYKILKMIYPQSVSLHSSINTRANKNNNEDSTLKFVADNCKLECDYIWLIHGIENHYEKLIEQLKSNNNSKTNIFNYCWLENLKDGSNRIEYLVNNKIKNLNEDRIEGLDSQPVLSKSMTITTKSVEQKKKEKKQIICDVDGCKKQYKNTNALKSHQLAKHPSARPVIHDETTAMTAACTTKKPKKATKKRKMECGVDNCRQSYKKLRASQKHQVETHLIPLRCLFSKECLDSNEKYLGIFNLQNHIIFQHEDSFSQRICPIAKCQNSKYWQDWPAALQHILQKHTHYLLDDIIPYINEQQLITSEINASTVQTKTTTNMPSWDLDNPLKCSYNDCDRSYPDKKALKRHEAFEHPVPLLCPFSSECQQSAKKIYWFMEIT